ncbi:MAG TPA: FAD-dependent monooxygenase [Candidatus Eremiobacteraceae bacterium]|nr:FAD-dependent monooxygenase [Candidatus Eremiobacteraceae bacterium]
MDEGVAVSVGPSLRVNGRILIVGAGPGGLTLGLLLARAGMTVSVFEQGATFEREFRGDSLLPGGLRVLEDLGLRARLHDVEHAFPSALRLHLGRSRPAFDSPALCLADGTPVVMTIPQARLLEALAGAASSFPGFALHKGTAVRDLVMEGGRVAGVRHADGETQADLVIGFDGRFSVTRRCAGIELETSRVDFDIAWCSIDGVGRLHDRYEASATGDEVCFWSPNGAALRIGWLLRKGGFDALRAAGLERFKERLCTALPEDLHAPLRVALRSWEDVTLLPAVSAMARRWWRPGLLLLGDAAHPMSPVGAQGINVALFDAVIASRHLLALARADAFERPAAVDAALAAIEAERRPAVKRIARMQNILPHLMLAIGPERALRLAVAVIRPFLRSRFRPGFVRAQIERFAWGDPPVRI